MIQQALAISRFFSLYQLYCCFCCFVVLFNLVQCTLTGRKRKYESRTSLSKKRKLSSEETCEKEKAKLDLIEVRARARIKARIRARIKAREAEELRLLELKALKENGWSDLIPYEVLLKIFQRVVDDSGPVPFLCR